MSAKDGNELARQYEAAGYRVEKGGRNHHKVYDAEGTLVASFAGTPNNDGARRDRRRFNKIMSGKLLPGRPQPEAGPEPAAGEPVQEIPAAFRKDDRRARLAELAASEEDILSRAGSLGNVRDIGDLFAGIEPAKPAIPRPVFTEKFDQHRRGRARERQRKRAGRAVNQILDGEIEFGEASGSCIACLKPCDTAFAPSFADAEGHQVFLEELGLPADQAYSTFRVAWNEHHTMFPITMENGVPEDWLIAGVPCPVRVCQECFDNFQRAVWGKRHVNLRDHPLPHAPHYAFEKTPPYDDGPEILARNIQIAAACMRLEEAVVEAADSDEPRGFQVTPNEARLLESVGLWPLKPDERS